MHIDSLQNTPPAAATAAVGDPPLSPAEAGEEAILYMGYLAILALAALNGSSPAGNEIVAIYDKIQGLVNQMAGGSTKNLVQNMLTDLQKDGSGVNVFFGDWLKNESNLVQDLNQNGYSFDPNTSPDTYFAMTMFMSALTMNPGPNARLAQEFFGQGSNGIFPCFQEAAYFLKSYLTVNGPDVNFIEAILPPGTSGPYADFLNTLSSWNIPGGNSNAQQAMEGAMVYYSYDINKMFPSSASSDFVHSDRTPERIQAFRFLNLDHNFV